MSTLCNLCFATLISGSRSRSMQLQPRSSDSEGQVCVADVETRSIPHQEVLPIYIYPTYLCNIYVSFCLRFCLMVTHGKLLDSPRQPIGIVPCLYLTDDFHTPKRWLIDTARESNSYRSCIGALSVAHCAPFKFNTAILQISCISQQQFIYFLIQKMWRVIVKFNSIHFQQINAYLFINHVLSTRGW